MRERTDLPFAMSEYRMRLQHSRQRMGGASLDVMIVTVPANMFYLTGYDTQGLFFFNALVLPLEAEPFMVTRFAEETVVEATTWVNISRAFRDWQDPMEVLADALREFGLDNSHVGYEGDSYYFRTGERDRLVSMCSNAKFADCAGLIEQQRVIKSSKELEYICQAARVTDAGMAAGIAAVKVGARENEIAAEVYSGLLHAGGHYSPLAPFVVSGPRSFVSHATWSDRTVHQGDCVFFEVGGCINRYHAGMMRSAHIGRLSNELKEAEQLVIEATDAAMAAIRPGAPTSEADAAARRIIGKNSFGASQYTRVGYSIGIAFPPGWGEGHIVDIKPNNESIFEENMTFHLIPFLQIPKKAAIGISETVRVTRTGCERLTSYERRVFER